MTLFLPSNFPKSQIVLNYVFGYNETHSALAVDYGSLVNHHDSFNVEASGDDDTQFHVRRGFTNHNVLQICSMYAFTHIHNRYMCT